MVCPVCPLLNCVMFTAFYLPPYLCSLIIFAWAVRRRRAGPSAAEPGSRAVAAAAARGLGATRGRRSPTVSAAGWTHSESLLRFFAFDFRKSIRFSVLSGSEIRKSAEVQVWNNRIYGHDMKPVPNGLLDPRMVMPRSELLFSRVSLMV